MSGDRIRGYHRANLIVDIAKGDMTLEALGLKYGGVTPQAINGFRNRNTAVIEKVREQVKEGTLLEVSGLWIADKVNRISLYEDFVETLVEEIENGDLEPKDIRGHIQRAQTSLHAVAEELGALPQRVQVEHSGGTEVTYKVAGIDPKDVT